MFLHDPDSGPLDYSIDFGPWLADGDSVDSADWSIFPDNDDSPTLSGKTKSGAIVTTNVTGGALGSVYTITARVVTTAGLTDDRSITIRVGQQ